MKKSEKARKMRKVILVFAIILAAVQVNEMNAQMPPFFTGHVLDTLGLPIKDVEIKVNPTYTEKITTDKEGKYTITSVGNAPYFLISFHKEGMRVVGEISKKRWFKLPTRSNVPTIYMEAIPQNKADFKKKGPEKFQVGVLKMDPKTHTSVYELL